METIVSRGRAIAFAEAGDSDGVPVFGFHGSPGTSGQVIRVADEQAASLGIRLVCPDRPGYGASGAAGRTGLADYPDDIVALADHLGIDAFGLVGVSAGSPFALACAYRFGDRVLGCTLASSVGHLEDPNVVASLSRADRLMRTAALRAPVVLSTLNTLLLTLQVRSPGFARRMLESQMSEPDREQLQDPDVLAAVMAGVSPADAKAITTDLRSFCLPWGFELADIETAVSLFHGTDDMLSPISNSRDLQKKLPDSTLTELAGEGHLGIMNHPEILASAAGL